MSAVLPLAGMFAGIILIGTAAVYLHDLLERRWLAPKLQVRGGGRGGPLVYRGMTSFGERRPAARGGQVVWVRAGSYASDLGPADQTRFERRSTAVTVRRVSSR